MGKKITYLDGLRGVSAFTVVLNHIAALFYIGIFTGDIHTLNLESKIKNSFLYVFVNGTFAVCIFFVLSGFVLSYKFFLTQDRKMIYEGLIRRYFRLVVPIAFSVLVSYLLMKFHFIFAKEISKVTFTNWDKSWNFVPDIWDMMKEIFFNLFFKHSTGKYNFVLWTMSYEFIGSLIVFATLFIVGRMNIKYRFLVYLLLILIFRSYSSGFVAGIAICDYMCNVNIKFLKNPRFNLLLFILSLLIGAYAHQFNFNSAKLEQIYLLIAGCMIVFSLTNSSLLQRAFSIQPFAWLGKISFSMYIIHVLILASFSSYLFLRIFEYFPHYNIAMFITIMISLPIIFGVSHLMYKYIDMTGVKFSKFIYELLSKVASYVIRKNIISRSKKSEAGIKIKAPE